MSILVVEPDSSEHAASVGRVLVRLGYEMHRHVIQPDASEPFGRVDHPPYGDFDAVVFMGSPWSVLDDRIQDWLEPHSLAIAEAVTAGQPFLGICFGAQALAAATGGTVSRAEEIEIGWTHVDSHVPALAGTWFQWHRDRIAPPLQADVLATTPGAVQAFALGSALGVQFHPEVDADHLCEWLSGGARADLEADGGDPEEIVEEAWRMEDILPPRVDAFVEWFLGLH